MLVFIFTAGLAFVLGVVGLAHMIEVVFNVGTVKGKTHKDKTKLFLLGLVFAGASHQLCSMYLAMAAEGL